MPDVPGTTDYPVRSKPHKQANVPGVPGVPGDTNGKEGQRHFSDEGTPSEKVAELFANPPEWLWLQAAECIRQGSPERLLNPLATAVSSHLFGSPWRWQEVLAEVHKALREVAM